MAAPYGELFRDDDRDAMMMPSAADEARSRAPLRRRDGAAMPPMIRARDTGHTPAPTTAVIPARARARLPHHGSRGFLVGDSSHAFLLGNTGRREGSSDKEFLAISRHARRHGAAARMACRSIIAWHDIVRSGRCRRSPRWAHTPTYRLLRCQHHAGPATIGRHRDGRASRLLRWAFSMGATFLLHHASASAKMRRRFYAAATRHYAMPPARQHYD